MVRRGQQYLSEKLDESESQDEADAVVEDVAWSYEDPLPESTQIAGWLSFDPARADVDAELPSQPSPTPGTRG